MKNRVARLLIACAAMGGSSLLGCKSDGPSEPSIATAFGPAVWVAPIPGGWMPPLLDGSMGYFETAPPSGESELVALDLASGTVRWRQPLPHVVDAAIAGEVVAVVWDDLTAYRRSTGELAWRFLPPNILYTNVVSDGVRFYAGTTNGLVHAIDAVTGEESWHAVAAIDRQSGATGIAVDGDLLVVTLTSSAQQPSHGFVVAFHAATGALRWRRDLADAVGPAAVRIPPVITPELVIAEADHGWLVALDRESGAFVWTRALTDDQTDGGAGNGLALCGGTVVGSSHGLLDRGLSAHDAQTGQLRWAIPRLLPRSLAGLRCSHGTLLAQTFLSLVVLDAGNGAVRRRYEPTAGDTVRASARDGGRLYLSASGGVYALPAP